MRNLIIIEGTIAAGKTMTLNRLKGCYRDRLVYVKEPVQYFKGMLNLYYQNKERYILPLQILIAESRIREMEKLLSQKNDDRPIIMERSVKSGEIFCKLITPKEKEMKVIKEIWDEGDRILHNFDWVCYHLKVTNEETIQNQIERNKNTNEGIIDSKYLKQINQLYNEHCEQLYWNKIKRFENFELP